MKAGNGSFGKKKTRSRAAGDRGFSWARGGDRREKRVGALHPAGPWRRYEGVARGSYPEVVSGVAKNDGDGVHATSSTDSASRSLCIYTSTGCSW
jgi:hypothetical protein